MTQEPIACKQCVANIILGEVSGYVLQARDVHVSLHTHGSTHRASTLADYAFGVSGGRLPLVQNFTDWEVLGVHRPITILSDQTDLSASVASGTLPSYVLRDQDRQRLRPALSVLTQQPPHPAAVRLIVLTGESSSGKTRAAVEAMRAELATWQLLVPAGPSGLATLLDVRPDLRYTVVWLDEVQDIIGLPDGGDILHRLFAVTPGPTVLLATLRTDAEDRIRDTPGWRLLDRRADRIHLQRRLTPRELQIATKLKDDPWISSAVAGMGDRYGLAEVLAAGPQLLREWERLRDRDPVAAAIVDAAVDCYRAGYTDCIPESLLFEAHQLYLDASGYPPQASAEVFAAALRRLRRPVCGASSLLVHTSGFGDRPFDYLLSHASQVSFEPVAPRIWTMLQCHATPHMLVSLAQAADRCGHLDIGTEYLRRAIASDSSGARILASRDDLDALRILADAGDGEAVELLADALYEHGGAEELRQRADGGDEFAQLKLADRLIQHGDHRELRERADKGDHYAGSRLAELLVQRSDEQELNARADNGDEEAQVERATLPLECGDEQGLRQRADAGDAGAPVRLAVLLKYRNDEQGLRQRAETGDRESAITLAIWYRERRDVRALYELAASELNKIADSYPDMILAILLKQRGDEHALVERADAGAHWAKRLLAELLTERHDERGLLARARTGDEDAERRLADLLAKRGADDALHRLAESGYGYVARRFNTVLLERGDEHELSCRSDAGDQDAEQKLVRLRSARGMERL